MAARERDERRTRWLLGGAGMGAFAVLKTLEMVIEPDEVTFAKMFLEVLEFALTVVAIGCIVILFERFQRNKDETLELMRDLDMARAEGEVWRSQARSYVEGQRRCVAVVAISEFTKRSVWLGAVLAALPVTSLLALTWLWIDTSDVEKVAGLSMGVFWAVPPTR